MPRNLSSGDPIGKELRRSRAQRRVGPDSKCDCGESRPAALITGADPMICAKCKRKQKGQSVLDRHHVAGKSNHELTIPVPVNSHRAILNDDMQAWPKETLENPDRAPILAAAACIRGFRDTVILLIDELLVWIADLLEHLHVILTEKFGDKYWTTWSLYSIMSQQ